MATPLTCADTERSTEELIRSLFVRMDDGSFAVKTTESSGGDPVDCDMAGIPSLEMLRGAIVREGSEFALQVQPVT